MINPERSRRDCSHRWPLFRPSKVKASHRGTRADERVQSEFLNPQARFIACLEFPLMLCPQDCKVTGSSVLAENVSLLVSLPLGIF